MSNPQTFYTAGGQDLSGIFQPLGSLTQALATGYKIPDGRDLNLVFASISSGTQIGYDTGFKANNGNYINSDLRLVFAAYNSIPFTTTGSPSYTYTSGYYTITFINSGTINFTSQILNTKLLVVGGGGGGGGGGGNLNQPNNNGGGGGGGGGIGYLNTTMNNAIQYTITVGTGGGAGNGHNGGGPGINSSFIQNSTNYLTSTGGGAGQGISTGSGGGAGGTSTSASAFTYTPYNGGAGGSVGYIGNPTVPLMPIIINSTNYYYSGGGAGGVGGIIVPLLGGGAGSNGTGGSLQASVDVNGINAVSYGSGGGGAAGNSGTINSLGGTGAKGVVIIVFQYP